MQERVKHLLNKTKTVITLNCLGILKTIICVQITMVNLFLATWLIMQLTVATNLFALMPIVVSLVYSVFTMLSLLCVHFIAEAQLR